MSSMLFLGSCFAVWRLNGQSDGKTIYKNFNYIKCQLHTYKAYFWLKTVS